MVKYTEEFESKLVTVKRAFEEGEVPPGRPKPEGLADAIVDYIAGWQAVGADVPVVLDPYNAGNGTIDPWDIVGFLVSMDSKSAVVKIVGNIAGPVGDEYRLVITTDGSVKGDVYKVDHIVRLSIVDAAYAIGGDNT